MVTVKPFYGPMKRYVDKYSFFKNNYMIKEMVMFKYRFFGYGFVKR